MAFFDASISSPEAGQDILYIEIVANGLFIMSMWQACQVLEELTVLHRDLEGKKMVMSYV